MTSRFPSCIAIAFFALSIFLAGCSSTTAADPAAGSVAATPAAASESAAGEPASDGPPGILYLTTANGQMQALTPASGATETLWTTGEGEHSAFEVAPVRRSSGLHVVLSGPESQLDTSLHELTSGGLQPVPFEEFTPVTICLDPHARADVSVGHELTLGTDGSNGSTFDQLAFDASGAVDETSVVELSRVSIVCPRYSGDRDVVATAATLAEDDPTSITTFIEGARGSHQIAIDGCNLTPTSFSPDDEWLLIGVVCYDSEWADSGLYAVPLVNLGQEITLDDMPRLGSGVFGRSAWHPGANWVVATRIEPIENQTPGVSFADQPADLVLIDIRTGDVIVQPVVGGSQPHSMAWLAEAVHGDS